MKLSFLIIFIFLLSLGCKKNGAGGPDKQLPLVENIDQNNGQDKDKRPPCDNCNGDLKAFEFEDNGKSIKASVTSKGDIQILTPPEFFTVKFKYLFKSANYNFLSIDKTPKETCGMIEKYYKEKLSNETEERSESRFPRIDLFGLYSDQLNYQVGLISAINSIEYPVTTIEKAKSTAKKIVPNVDLEISPLEVKSFSTYALPLSFIDYYYKEKSKESKLEYLQQLFEGIPYSNHVEFLINIGMVCDMYNQNIKSQITTSIFEKPIDVFYNFEE